MKYNSIIFPALLCLAAALPSCKKNEIGETPANVEFTLRAAMSPQESKIALGGDDHKHILWSAGEEIKVFRGSASAKFTTDAPEGSSTATFTGTLPTDAKGDFWAVCPFSEQTSFDSSKKIFTLDVPSVQTSPEGSFTSACFPILAHSNTTSLSFYNLCGGAKFCVADEGITKVVISGNNDEDIAGQVTVNFDSEGKPQTKSVVSAAKSITLTPEGSETFTPGVYYYAVMLPQTFSKGISISYTKGLSSAVFSHSGSITVSRGGFGSISNKEQGLEFLTPFTTITEPGEYSATNTRTPSIVANDSDQASIAKLDTGDNTFLRYTMFNLDSGRYIKVDVPQTTLEKGTALSVTVTRDAVSTSSTMTVSRITSSLVWLEDAQTGSGFIIPLE